MILLILAYLGGVLTIVSPCILPVLPFVFARADQPFVRSGLPLLAGMAATFALVATLATLGGSWAVHANQYGRIAAMVLLTLFDLTLLAAVTVRAADAAFGGAGQQIVQFRQRCRRRQRHRFAAAGCRHGIAVGALRRADPGTDPHGRGDQWRQRQHHLPAAGLCGGCRHIAGCGVV